MDCNLQTLGSLDSFSVFLLMRATPARADRRGYIFKSHTRSILRPKFLLQGKQTIDRDFLDPVSPGGPPTSNVAQLHSKLQAAAQRIRQLSQEKEQLIQTGNRLRAELAKYSGKV